MTRDPFKKRPVIRQTPSIVLCNPKFPHNVGAAIRAASCFGVEEVWVTGTRCADEVRTMARIPREERMRNYEEVLLVLDDYPATGLPEGATPVAIELLPGAENLTAFEHPANPVYLFGPEDGSVPPSLRQHCHRRVFIPTRHCVNLSAAVYLVLYDRLVKRIQSGAEQPLPIDEVLGKARASNGWHEPRDVLGGGVR